MCVHAWERTCDHKWALYTCTHMRLLTYVVGQSAPLSFEEAWGVVFYFHRGLVKKCDQQL